MTVKAEKKKKSRVLTAGTTTWRTFTQETSIHGLKYTTTRRMLDRWVWCVMVVGCGTMAGVLVGLLTLRYLSNPTRSVYITQHQPVPEMHFPAVTLCAPRKITNYYVKNLLSKLKLPYDVSEARVSQALPQLLGLVYPVQVDETSLSILDRVLSLNDLDTELALLSLAPPCSDVIVRCQWMGKDLPCTALFKRSRTHTGFCCTFNYNSDVKGFPQDALTLEYIGPDMGLSFVVDTFIEEFANQVYHKMDSFKLLVHGSESYASRLSDEVVLAQRKEVFIACTVQSFVTGPQASLLEPSARRCLLPTEKPLRNFESYTKANCLLECEADACTKRCGCLPFTYPRLPGEVLCNASSIPCVQEHFRAVQKEEWPAQCNCPRNCNQNITNIDVHSSQLRAYKLNPNPFYSSTTVNQSMVHVFHARQVSTVVGRTIYTYWVDLISSFGGMFNLFLGCSFISVLEFLYFLVLRFPRNVLNKTNAK